MASKNNPKTNNVSLSIDSKKYKQNLRTNIKLYPGVNSLTWRMIHKKPLMTKEEKEEMLKRKKLEKEKKEAFRKKRMNEYNLLDERHYYFTFEQYCQFLEDENFDIEQCHISTIREKERIEEERKKKEKEKRYMDRKNKLEFLKNHPEYSYNEYFYKNKPFLDDDDSLVSDYNSNYMYYNSDYNSDNIDNSNEFNISETEYSE